MPDSLPFSVPGHKKAKKLLAGKGAPARPHVWRCWSYVTLGSASSALPFQ